MRSTLRSSLLVPILFAVAGHAAQAAVPSSPHATRGWAAGFDTSGFSDAARASVVFDDGGGPALYVAGRFTSVGKVVASRIARWDGSSWSPLWGPSGEGTDGEVRALAVFDDGTGPALFAAGEFSTAGGVAATRVAKWDGTEWTALSGPFGEGVDGEVRALAVFDDGTGPALYAGGLFLGAGGVPARYVARWSGSEWSALAGSTGEGTEAWVEALAVFDDGGGPALFVAGTFDRAGGLWANYVARWRGGGWSALGGRWNGAAWDVLALAVFDDGSGPSLVLAGRFEAAGDVFSRHVVKWDGSKWSALDGVVGEGVNDWVFSLGVFDDGSGPALFASGWFTEAGGVPASRIAKWRDGVWSALSAAEGDGTDYSAFALTAYDDGSGPALYLAGEFVSVGGALAGRIARWDGRTLRPLAAAFGSGLVGGVRALLAGEEGDGAYLYAGGWFLWAGEVAAGRIARWDGSTWSALADDLGAGVSGWVLTLAAFDDGGGPALFVGGHFDVAGGAVARSVAKWDGHGWSALEGPQGTGTPGGVRALAVYDDGRGPALYAVGPFTVAGGVPAHHVARWDGAGWSALAGPSGEGTNGDVNALAVYDDGSGSALYAAGTFTTAGGVPASGIARWDGTAWAPLGGSYNWWVGRVANALTVYDDGTGPALFIGGSFTMAAGLEVDYLAKWDGESLSGVFGASGEGLDGPVLSLATLETGCGQRLYVGGSFGSAGGSPAAGIASWDGESWSALAGPAGDGIRGDVFALAAFPGAEGVSLFAGGDFGAAGGVASANIANWRCRTAFPFADGFEWGALGAWDAILP